MYYPVTVDSFDFTNSIFSTTPETQQRLQEALSIISLGTASAITLVSSYNSTKKFYNQAASLYNRVSSYFCGTHVNQQNQAAEDRILGNKRLAVGLVAAFFAACNASMQSEVALEFLDLTEINARLELSAMMFSQLSLCFWAVDELLLDYLRSSNPKDPLLRKLTKMKKKLNSLSPESVFALERIMHTAVEPYMFTNLNNANPIND
ncbi:MAG: hypothetical protein JSS34_08045 [Proteobacteria bacterium]|nr:hypothetical protein [Pseudomonadota bacterium]